MMESANGLGRFLQAQDGMYEVALSELKAGRKRNHWIWYIFPQLRGLGRSAYAQIYGIDGMDEARRYLAHPLLRARLDECCEALLAQPQRDPRVVMGSEIDSVKLRSSMTLFAHAAGEDSIYRHVLDEFYGGREDEATLAMLKDRQ